MPKRWKGSAWGPDLPDGKHVLFVASDNDLPPGLQTQIYAFAIDGTVAGVNYQPQEVGGSMFPVPPGGGVATDRGDAATSREKMSA